MNSTTSKLEILSRFVECNRNLQLFSLFRLLVDFVLRARANTQQLADSDNSTLNCAHCRWLGTAELD